MAATQFSKPVPGNSLATHKVGERPWERPPQMSTVDEALKFYINKLNDQEVIDDMMVAIDIGVPIKPIVEAMYVSGTMNGYHTLDVGILVAPAITEFLVNVAKDYGIAYKISAKDPNKAKEQKERDRIKMMLDAAVSKGMEQGAAEDDEGLGLLREMSAAMDVTEQELMEADGEVAGMEEPVQGELPLEEPTQEQPPAAVPEGQGLMARG